MRCEVNRGTSCHDRGRVRGILLLTAVLLLFGCRKPAPPPPQTPPDAAVAPARPADPAAAKAANVQGMRHYRKKQLTQAAASFRAAIAADPGHVLAHYNLACVLALTGDKAGAVQELEWLARSADPQATRALARAKRDSDLTALREDPKVKPLIATAAERALFIGFQPLSRGRAASEDEAESLDGLGDETSDNAMAVSGEVVAGKKGPEVVVASLAGAALLDGSGKTLATTPGGESFGGGTSGSVDHLWLGQVVPDAEPEIVAHVSWNGRRIQGDDLVVLKRRGDKLAVIFKHALSMTEYFDSQDEDTAFDSTETTAEAELLPDGTIRTVARPDKGRKEVDVLRWDARKFAFRGRKGE